MGIKQTAVKSLFGTRDTYHVSVTKWFACRTAYKECMFDALYVFIRCLRPLISCRDFSLHSYSTRSVSSDMVLCNLHFVGGVRVGFFCKRYTKVLFFFFVFSLVEDVSSILKINVITAFTSALFLPQSSGGRIRPHHEPPAFALLVFGMISAMIIFSPVGYLACTRPSTWSASTCATLDSRRNQRGIVTKVKVVNSRLRRPIICGLLRVMLCLSIRSSGVGSRKSASVTLVCVFVHPFGTR